MLPAKLPCAAPHPVDLTTCCDHLQAQRDYLDAQIRGLSNSHVIHPGIQRQKVPLLPAHARIKEIAVPLKVGPQATACVSPSAARADLIAR